MKGKDTLSVAAKALLVSAFLLLTGSAKAQVSLHLGVTSGPQITKLTSTMGSYGSKMGVNFGPYVEMRFGSYLAARLEGGISVKGGTRNYTDSLELPTTNDAVYYNTQIYNYNTTENLTYYQGALLVQGNLPLKRKRVLPYDLENDGGLFLSVFAGPYYGYLANHVRTGSTEYIEKGPYQDTALVKTLPGNQPERETQGVFPGDIGVIGGLGVNYSFSGVTLGLSGRYQMGFVNIDDGSYGREVVGHNGTEYVIMYQYANIVNSAIAINLSVGVRLFD